MIRVGSVCSGVGGLDLAFQREGASIAWHAEIDAYASRVLASRWPGVVNVGDWTTWEPEWDVSDIDLLIGGIPCQGNSVAGRREGVDDERNLWPAFARLVEALKPRAWLVENVRGLLTASDGDMMASICEDADRLGYSVEWDVCSAAYSGAPHRRERIFLCGRNDGAQTWPQTEQPSMFAGRPQSWPVAGRWTDGFLHERETQWPTPKLAGGVREWPTARAITGGAEGAERKRELGRGASEGGDLQAAVQQWATPAARDWRDGRASDETFTGNARPLNEQVQRWTTPRALDGNPKGDQFSADSGERLTERIESQGCDVMLNAQVRMHPKGWTTPRAGDSNQGPSSTAKHLESGDLMLTDQVKLWPSPDAGVYNDGEDVAQWQARREELREKHANGNGCGTPLAMAARIDASQGRLSPDWTETLMGWPVGWTDLDCDEPEAVPYPLPMACGPDGSPLYGASPQGPWEPPRLVEPRKGDNRRHRLRCIGNGVELGTGRTVARSVLASMRAREEASAR